MHYIGWKCIWGPVTKHILLFLLSVDVKSWKRFMLLNLPEKNAAKFLLKTASAFLALFSFALWVKFWGYKQQPEPVTPSRLFLCMDSLSVGAEYVHLLLSCLFFFCLTSNLFRIMLCVLYGNISSNLLKVCEVGWRDPSCAVSENWLCCCPHSDGFRISVCMNVPRAGCCWKADIEWNVCNGVLS